MDEREENIFEMPDPAYLRHLADRIHRIPGDYDVDGGDYDRLRSLATELEGDDKANLKYAVEPGAGGRHCGCDYHASGVAEAAVQMQEQGAQHGLLAWRAPAGPFRAQSAAQAHRGTRRQGSAGQ